MRDNIFTELYNKLLGFFRQAEEEESAKDVACNRLRVVLMQDRTNLTPQILERMRGELVELLSKYLEMDKEALELNLEQEGDQMALMLSIPVIRAKDEEEIEQALAEEEAKKAEEADDKTEKETNEEEVSETAEATADVVETVEEDEPAKEFPNKEICGDCKECELSDDIECEKKNQIKKTKK
ncbi:cell division topological specificity factor MinE [bacterium]|nr:cell division topological specificity factor MinE [bacterium]